MRSIALILFFFGDLLQVRASNPEQLVENLRRAAQPGGTSVAAKQQLLEAGPDVIPYLLPLLCDDDETVRVLAAWTLTEVNGLSEEHLENLVEAYRKGVRLIGIAIARVGTPRAVDFIVEALVSDGDSVHLQSAIEILGAKVVPGMVQFYQADNEWNTEQEEAMVAAFRLLHTRAKSAIEPLLEMANDAKIPIKRRVRAIAALGAIAVSNNREVEALQSLQKSRNCLIKDAVLEALVFIRLGDAWVRITQIRELAKQKTHAKHAGPGLVRDLNAGEWDVRVAAARAIGYIGFEDAVDALTPILHRNDDWRLVFCAAESLGRLRAEKAVSALETVSKGYWYPPVREAATRALASIRGSGPQDSRSADGAPTFEIEFDDYDRGQTNLDSIAEEEAGFIRFAVAGTPNDMVPVTAKKTSGRNKEELRGVKVSDGYLVGSDLGEFGGELTYVDPNGKARVLAPENTEAIYKAKAGIVAVTGLAHMGFNDGCLFKINKGADGQWSASKWRVLPGAPRFSRLLKDGNLFVSCHGGLVMVSPDGGMRFLTLQESVGFKPPSE